jgi:hypothetical protein
MFQKGSAVIVGILSIGLMSAFTWVGRNNFVNGTREVINLTYKTTMKTVDKPIRIGPGRGLVSDDDGELLRVMVTYPNAKTVKLSERDVSQLRRASRLKTGVWWINLCGLEYISNRESLVRRKRIFGRW